MEGRNLYNKHRPKSFEEIIGNEKILAALTKKLTGKTIPNVILLSGDFGCGKTTIARIIPSILKVHPSDVKEMNNASLRGIDDMRVVEESSKSKPMNPTSKYKIYIFDEFHAVSSDAKNAVLKWTEDPPKHVISIICTTEPQTLGKGLLSRCLKFAVKPLSDTEMQDLLTGLAKKEGIAVKNKVMSAIVSSASGCPRSAINLLEMVEGLSLQEALEVIDSGETENPQLNKLFQSLLKSDWESCSEIIKGITETQETVRRAGLGYFSSIVLNSKGKPNQFTKKAVLVLDAFSDSWYDSGKSSLIRSCYGICHGV